MNESKFAVVVNNMVYGHGDHLTKLHEMVSDYNGVPGYHAISNAIRGKNHHTLQADTTGKDGENIPLTITFQRLKNRWQNL